MYEQKEMDDVYSVDAGSCDSLTLGLRATQTCGKADTGLGFGRARFASLVDATQ